ISKAAAGGPTSARGRESKEQRDLGSTSSGQQSQSGVARPLRSASTGRKCLAVQDWRSKTAGAGVLGWKEKEASAQLPNPASIAATAPPEPSEGRPPRKERHK